jgi:hypothetical protein
MSEIIDDNDLRRLMEIAKNAPPWEPPETLDGFWADPEKTGPTLDMVNRYYDRTDSHYAFLVSTHWYERGEEKEKAMEEDLNKPPETTRFYSADEFYTDESGKKVLKVNRVKEIT